MINIAILGYGTVGSGVAEVIEKNQGKVSRKATDELVIKYILDVRDFPGDPYQDRITNDFERIVGDPEVSIICESIGGINPAYDFTKRALLAGKSVCTSNKELVAAHAPELLAIAREMNCNYLFEASVGGGIPIIRPLNYSLAAEQIECVIGILNGTTNFILTKMEKEGADFDAVLREAQRLGYAEMNPADDVDGIDVCRKIAILSSLMTGRNVRHRDIHTEGITAISATDFLYAKALGMTIKLLAHSQYDDDGRLGILVAPFMLGPEHPLYFVSGVYNAVFVRGTTLGDSMYYGQGAGKLPTASAIVSDIVDCARHPGKTTMCFWDSENVEIAPISERKGRFFVRMASGNENTNAAAALFASHEAVSVSVTGEYAFICGPMSEADFERACAALPGGIISRIRIS